MCLNVCVWGGVFRVAWAAVDREARSSGHHSNTCIALTWFVAVFTAYLCNPHLFGKRDWFTETFMLFLSFFSMNRKMLFLKMKKEKKRKTTNTSTQTKAGTIGFVFLTYTGCLAFTTLCNTCWTRFEFKTSKDKVLGFLKKCFKFALPDGLKMSSEPSPIFVYTCGDSSTRSEYMQNIYKRGFRSTALSFSLLSAKDIPAFLHPPQPSVHVLLYCNCIQCTTITCTHLS